MSFGEAVGTALLMKYADFTGRARRSEYWWFTLVQLALLFVASGIAQVMGTLIPYWVVGLVLVVPAWAARTRRLHDTGHSGKYWLFLLIPVVGWAMVLFWLVQPSDPGPNRYGWSPLDDGVPAGIDYGPPPTTPDGGWGPDWDRPGY